MIFPPDRVSHGVVSASFGPGMDDVRNGDYGRSEVERPRGVIKRGGLCVDYLDVVGWSARPTRSHGSIVKIVSSPSVGRTIATPVRCRS